MGLRSLSIPLLSLVAGLLFGVGMNTFLQGNNNAVMTWSCLLGSVVALGIAFSQFGMRQFEIGQLAVSIRQMAQPGSEIQRVETGAGLAPLAVSVNDLTARLLHGTDVVSKERGKLLAILSSMVEGVIAVDTDDRIVHLNAAATRILQLGQNQDGLRFWEAIRNPQLVMPLQDVLRDGHSRTTEVLMPRRKQDQVIELAVAPLRDGDGKLAGAVAVMHDVTELRHLQGMRKDFVANVSHELKTPLTAISGLVETILSDQSAMDPAQLQQFLQRVQRQNDRMITLVQDLLTLSRIESEEYELSPERYDLTGVVTDIIRTYRPQAEIRGLSLRSELPGEPVPLHIDVEAVRQIINNLVDNAIKYTPEGGQVVVSLTAREDTVECSVADTGLGIPEDEQDRIFERFYRVDKGRSREIGGTGLGLAIVKHLARALGGQISLASRLGQGSTFTLRLPDQGVAGLNPALTSQGENP
jgi:two-component system phosphate regulon sensor histidine kinase PhoR